MSNCNILAIDLAKNLFQVCKTDKHGNVIFNKIFTRKKLKELLIREKQSLVAMESCSGTHHWARYAKQAGHHVKAINARKVKAFLQGQKTDANDALAISVAARQPHIKASRLISAEEQCLQGIECIRDLLVKQRISLSNQIRALLLELGHSIAQTDAQLMKNIPDIFEDANNDLTPAFRSSGGKEKIGSISKMTGNKKLRSALYKGALAVSLN